MLSQIVISKKEVAKNLEGTPFDIDVICNIYFNTFFCILSHWIEGESQDPMQPIEMITHIFSKGVPSKFFATSFLEITICDNCSISFCWKEEKRIYISNFIKLETK